MYIDVKAKIDSGSLGSSGYKCISIKDISLGSAATWTLVVCLKCISTVQGYIRYNKVTLYQQLTSYHRFTISINALCPYIIVNGRFFPGGTMAGKA